MVMKTLMGIGTLMYEDEIVSIARVLEIKPSLAILLQLIYEASACCTTIVKHLGSDPKVTHLIRTMDWPVKELKAVTIDVSFTQNGEELFKATTWAGYVGILTGMNQKYAISVNFRKSNGNLLGNIRNAVAGYWPIGYLVRDVFECDRSYNKTLKRLQNTDIIAPTYFTISGIRNAKILARDPRDIVYEKDINSEDGILIQTNMDSDTYDMQNIL